MGCMFKRQCESLFVGSRGSVPVILKFLSSHVVNYYQKEVTLYFARIGKTA